MSTLIKGEVRRKSQVSFEPVDYKSAKPKDWSDQLVTPVKSPVQVRFEEFRDWLLSPGSAGKFNALYPVMKYMNRNTASSTGARVARPHVHAAKGYHDLQLDGFEWRYWVEEKAGSHVLWLGLFQKDHNKDRKNGVDFKEPEEVD